MSQFEIWLTYLSIVAIAYILFISIKEDTKDWKLKLVKNISAFIAAIVGITLLVFTFVVVLDTFFPNLGSNSSGSDYECERDPLFGGCN